MKKLNPHLTASFIVAISLSVTIAQGGLVSCDVTADPLDGQNYGDPGTYKYTISIEWADLSYAVSHWSLELKPGCAELDHLI